VQLTADGVIDGFLRFLNPESKHFGVRLQLLTAVKVDKRQFKVSFDVQCFRFLVERLSRYFTNAVNKLNGRHSIECKLTTAIRLPEKCKKSRRDSRAAPSRSAVTPLNDMTTHGRRELLCTPFSSALPLIFVINRAESARIKDIILLKNVHNVQKNRISSLNVFRS